jgi:uncharacterized coiled-coil protein SlyX
MDLFASSGLNVAVIVALVAAVAGPLGGYIMAARKMSGKIGTSEAASLWEEAGKLRAEYRGEAEGLRKTVATQEVTIVELQLQVASLRQENQKLQQRVVDLTHQVDDQEIHISRVEAELAKFKDGSELA